MIRPPRSSPRASHSASPRCSNARPLLEQRAGCASGSLVNARTASKPWSACSSGTSAACAISGGSGTSKTASSCSSPSGSAKTSEPFSRFVSMPSPPSRSAQKSSASVERDAVDQPVHHPGARLAGRGARVLEERQVVARRALLVAVEEVVDRGVVLVDGLLDHPQAHDARVEVDVARRVARDAGDVVDALELHARGYTRTASFPRARTSRSPHRCARAGTRR